MRLEMLRFAVYLTALTTVCSSCSNRREENVQANRKIELGLMGGGMITNSSGGDFIAYGLYGLAGSKPLGDEDFLLVFRNINSKFLNLTGITADNFKVQDSKGMYQRLAVRSLPKSIAWGEATLAHIMVIDCTNASYPLTLTFTATVETVPVTIRVTDKKPNP